MNILRNPSKNNQEIKQKTQITWVDIETGDATTDPTAIKKIVNRQMK